MLFLEPSKPPAPTGSRISDTYIKLSWSSYDEGTIPVTYNVNWNPASSLGKKYKLGVQGRSSTIDALRSNTEYEFRVTAINDVGSSPPSDGQRIKTSKSVYFLW